jgi:hypothetical protein
MPNSGQNKAAEAMKKVEAERKKAAEKAKLQGYHKGQEQNGQNRPWQGMVEEKVLGK